MKNQADPDNTTSLEDQIARTPGLPRSKIRPPGSQATLEDKTGLEDPAAKNGQQAAKGPERPPAGKKALEDQTARKSGLSSSKFRPPGSQAALEDKPGPQCHAA